MKNKEPKKIKIRPVGSRILVLPDPPRAVSEGGIILPEAAKETPQLATVMALGPAGYRVMRGGRQVGTVPHDVKVGDRVLTNKYGGTEVVIAGQRFKIMAEDEIIAIAEEV